MSFSFTFAAASKKAALNQLGTLSMPDSVRAFVVQALEAMEDKHAIHVIAVGHLYDGRNSYPTSTATISITPLEYVAEPNTDAVPD
jgi:hypothetical protein